MIRTKLMAGLMAGALLTLGGATAAQAQSVEDCPYGGCPTTTTTGGGGGSSTTGGGGGGSTTTPAPDDIPTIPVVRGQSVDISGDGCAPGSEVVVTFDDGTVLGTFTADENGNFVTTITIPSDSTLGLHLVTATCGDVDQFVNVNVLAEAGNNGNNNGGVNNGALPRTGSSNTGPLVGIGAAALVLGAAFVYGSRRPRTTE